MRHGDKFNVNTACAKMSDVLLRRAEKQHDLMFEVSSTDRKGSINRQMSSWHEVSLLLLFFFCACIHCVNWKG